MIRADFAYKILVTLVTAFILFSSHTVFSKTYYIDPNSVGGACSNYGEGTETQPFCSFFTKFWDHAGGSNNVDIGPDDIIIFREGTYGERLSVKESANFSGAQGHPVIIRPYDGENVVLDGSLYTHGGGRTAILMPGIRNYIHIYAKEGGGSIELRNWTNGLDSTGPSGEHNGWEIRDLVGRNFTGRGLMFRGFDNLTLRNIHLSVLTGEANESVVFGFRDGSNNVYAYDCIAEQANDGKGPDGDADGFWSPGNAGGPANGPLYFENCEARYMSEDGFDFKDPAILRGCKSIGNTTCGAKFWNAQYDIDGFISILNGEDGIKLSNVSAGSVLNHVTSAFNFEEGLQFRSTSADIEVKNSIFAWNARGAIRFDSQSSSQGSVNVNLHHNLYFQSDSRYLISTGCSGYDYVSIAPFATDLEQGFSCGAGTISGTELSTLQQDPEFTKALDATKIVSIQISEGPTENLNQVTMKQGNNYSWPGYQVGTYIELNNDAVLRKVTQVDDAQFKLYFVDDPLSFNYSGRSTDGDGVRVTDWGSTPPVDLTYDVSLLAGSIALSGSESSGEIGYFGYLGTDPGDIKPHSQPWLLPLLLDGQ
jgi:hypothetical protein